VRIVAMLTELALQSGRDRVGGSGYQVR